MTTTTRIICICVMASSSLSFSRPILAHVGVHERIEALTAQIEQSPGSAELYLKRGELHRLHEDWESALADFNRALEIDPDFDSVYIARGRMNFEARRLETALVDLSHFLAREPNHLEGLVTRARVLVLCEEPLLAARDYDRAIEQMKQPTPEYFLERANALAMAGAPYLDEAIVGLDEAIEVLGPLVTLEQRAIELEIRRHRYPEALSRLDQIERWTPRERWFQQRGEILHEAGRIDEALQAFSRAMAHIESLPPHRRRSESVRELEEKLRAAQRRAEVR